MVGTDEAIIGNLAGGQSGSPMHALVQQRRYLPITLTKKHQVQSEDFGPVRCVLAQLFLRASHIPLFEGSIARCLEGGI
ncbi:hypothetical protein D3C85_1880320 [compost metagenome]